MKIKALTDHVIKVSKKFGEFPKTMKHKKEEYVFGTIVDEDLEKRTAIYYLKTWLH